MSLTGGCLQRTYGDRIKPTVYALRLKKNRNFIADLSDPIKIRSIYDDLKRYLSQVDPKDYYYLYAQHFLTVLEAVQRNNVMFSDIRLLLENGPKVGGTIYGGGYAKLIYKINDFLKSIGYHGLRCPESGESKSILPWVTSMTYLIFDSNDVEIISEEHFALKNGKLIKVK